MLSQIGSELVRAEHVMGREKGEAQSLRFALGERRHVTAISHRNPV